jgi:peptidoglycan/LPS O-acetylase OafA/YrhL
MVPAPPTPTQQQERAVPRHIPELDGIRGIAILLVIAFHLNVSDPGGVIGLVGKITKIGWCGVDLFFVLSGFLITGILLDAKRGPHMLRNFYARRCLRILPLYYAALFAFFVLMPLFGRGASTKESEVQIWFWLHVSNWNTAFDPYAVGNLTHFWSLAVEEQFYLFWPFVVLFAPRRRVLWIALALITIAIVLRNLPLAQRIEQAYPDFLYRITPFRMDSLLTGAVAAIVIRDGRLLVGVRRALPWLALAGVGIVALSLADAGWLLRVGYNGFALAFGSAVLAAGIWTGSGAIAARLVQLPLLRSVGKYSYCMYVMHLKLISYRHYLRKELFAVIGNGPIATLGSVIGIVALVYGMAVISWYCFERHFLEFQARFR